MLWKVEGLTGYDIRRPMVPTGTNLLGLIKHLAGVELGYFGETVGRQWVGARRAGGGASLKGQRAFGSA